MASNIHETFIVAAKRTPIGKFQGSLSGLSAPQLGSAVMTALFESVAGSKEKVDSVIMGEVLTAGVGQAPARQAAIGAGVSVAVPAVTVGKVCGSGLKAVIMGTQEIALGDASVVVAGGQESMSRAPYLLPDARSGHRMGHRQASDSMLVDGLWDPFGDKHMGNCAEMCARKFGFSREAQDAFAKESYTKAQEAWAKGAFVAEVVTVEAPQGRKVVTVSQDDEPGAAQFEKMPQLRPAFEKEGTVTAANASKINDGAAALLLASGEACQANNWKPLAKVVAYAGHAQEPDWFTTAPVGAMKKLFEKTGLRPDQIDLFEINEAFSNVTMAAIKELELPEDRVNVNGGAVALGHPIGASGARILTTLVHALHSRDKKTGVASICLGGGEALAVLVERA